MKLNVSQISSPGNLETIQPIAENLMIPSIPSRNISNFINQEANLDENGTNLQKVRFKERGILKCKKFTSPNPNSSNLNNNSMNQSINSPSCIKVIDLRNPQVRKLVMESLNEIVNQRKKQRSQFNQNYENILQSTPSTLKVQNSLTSDAILIEKGNLNNSKAKNNFNDFDSKPPSRISNSGYQSVNPNNGILLMSPRSQQKFFDSLNKIYQEQDQRRPGQDFIEEPNSPEYTIVSAIDDSCILFAVKENQQNPQINVQSDYSSLNSTQKLITPAINRNIYDPQGIPTLDNPSILQQLTQKLQGIENNQEASAQNSTERINEQESIQQQGLIEQYSIDKQFLMIHPRNVQKLTPILQAPQVSRQPSESQINFFDLSIPSHVDILIQRLQQLKNLDENEPTNNSNNEDILIENIQQEVSTDNLTTIFLSYLDEGDDESPLLKNAQTPLQTKGPPSRAGNGNEQINFDVLLNKLLEIPNEELLDSLINLSVGSSTPNLFSNQQNSAIPEKESSNAPSSGAITPQSNSLSTPIQTRMYLEKGYFLAAVNKRALDLRSPHTKFNLMRKLQAVKEQNNSSEESDDDLQRNEDQTGRFNDYAESQVYLDGSYKTIEFRSVNDYSRLFINEEDELEEFEQEEQVMQEQIGEHTKPISLASPPQPRSLNQTLSNLQLRNQNNQFQPSIELLIQKLKNLEKKRMRNNYRLSSKQSSESQSPIKFDSYRGNLPEKNILEQVIKRLERLKSRDSSV